MRKTALTQASLIAAYCFAISLVMGNAEKMFGKIPNTFGPVAFLLLFSSSALICGLLVFYKPYLLFFANKKREAIDLVVYTAAFLFIYFALFITLAIVIK